MAMYFRLNHGVTITSPILCTDVRRFACVALWMVAPTVAASQETPETSLFWGPPQRSVSVGISTIVDDSESSTPIRCGSRSSKTCTCPSRSGHAG